MGDPRNKGRMIRRDVRISEGLAKLSPKALSLFLMLIPFYDGYGKMLGDPAFIKHEVCPLIPWLSTRTIGTCLAEIHAHTNVKWFEHQGLRYLHSLAWREHQDLRQDRLGPDSLPSFPSRRPTPGVSPGLTPGVSPEEVPELVRREVKLSEEKLRTTPGAPARAREARRAAPEPGNGARALSRHEAKVLLDTLRREVADGCTAAADARKVLEEHGLSEMADELDPAGRNEKAGAGT